MDFTDVTLDQIKKYLERTGQRGSEVLSILGRLNPTVKALFDNEVGKEILRLDLARTEELMLKVYKGEMSEDERAELRYLRDMRLPWVTGILKKYMQNMEEINKISQ